MSAAEHSSIASKLLIGSVVVIWGLGALGAYWASQVTGRPVIICPLRRYTGIPCPICGGTRAFVSLATLHPLEALAFNPLVAIGLVIVPIWAIRRKSRGLRLIDWHPSWRVLTLLGVLVAANWAYVLWKQSGT
ncbi:MAG: DUF2752 domain-containing protein [Phycisphaerales bacterium]|jgi:hypothetical protein